MLETYIVQFRLGEAIGYLKVKYLFCLVATHERRIIFLNS